MGLIADCTNHGIVVAVFAFGKSSIRVITKFVRREQMLDRGRIRAAESEGFFDGFSERIPSICRLPNTSNSIIARVPACGPCRSRKLCHKRSKLSGQRPRFARLL